MQPIIQENSQKFKSGHIGIALILATIVIVGGGAVLLNPFTNKVNCENKYDAATNGEIEPEEIPDECRPLPEEVEKKLLLEALRGS